MVTKDGVGGAVAAPDLSLSTETNLYTLLKKACGFDDDVMDRIQHVDSLGYEC
jgi:hypothetical protein